MSTSLGHMVTRHLSRIILDVFVRVLLNEINIQIGRLIKADCLSLMWMGLIQSVEDLNRAKKN